MNLKQARHYGRNIFDLTNQEIIRLVDFLINQSNLDRIAHSLSVSRNLIYRKIEVKQAYYDWAYAVVVTLRFSSLDKDVKTGFILANQGGARENELREPDFEISSIKGFFEPFKNVVLGEVSAEYEIDFDYSNFLIYVKELYDFLDTDLRMWSAYLPLDKYAHNSQLVRLYQQEQPEHFLVQELSEVADREKLLMLSN